MGFGAAVSSHNPFPAAHSDGHSVSPMSPTPATAQQRRQLARAWADALDALPPHPPSWDANTVCFDLAELVLDAVSQPAAESAAAAGAALVEAGITEASQLAASIAVVTEQLSVLAPAARTGVIVGAFAAGYSDELRERAVTESARIRRTLRQTHTPPNPLQVAEAHFRAVFDAAVIGIAVCDVDGHILDGNPALLGMLGVTLPELQAQSVPELLTEAGNAQWVRQFSELVRGERDNVRFDHVQRLVDGRTLATDVVVSLVRDGDGEPCYVVGMVADVTEQRRLRARLEFEASHDPLTGLANRTLFFSTLAQAMADPTQRVGLCFVDLDRFKTINDSLGHQIGDEVLVEVAARLRRCAAGAGHLAARVGGDEFVVVLTGTSDTTDATGLADEILAVLSEPFRIAGYELTVSASVGVVEAAAADWRPHDLVKAADVTLYWAKSQGKGAWALYDAQRAAAQVTRYTLSAAMPAALADGEFFLEYQPLVRLTDRRVVGVEALVRWRHPHYGVVPPGDFITIAEETGLIVELGRWVLREACLQAQRWRERFGARAPFMSVNLAVRQLEDPQLVADVRSVLAETGLPASLLQLEITESALIGSPDAAATVLTALTALGVRIALDDFGTGYCNLAYLRRIPVHCLKIAGDFVAGLRQSVGTDEKIVAMMVDLAHTLGLSVTAEGIETQAQADRLSAIECDSGQGWHFARPMSHQRVAALLEAPAA